MVTTCSGRFCDKESIGTLNEVREVTPWRTSNDRPVNQRQYDIVGQVHFCAEHEEIARAYQKRCVGFSEVSDIPVTEEMREIMRENSRNLEEMLTKKSLC